MTPLEEIHDALRRAGDAGDGVLTTVSLGALRALVKSSMHNVQSLPFIIRGENPPVIDWSAKGGSGCHPATAEEAAMWNLLTSPAVAGQAVPDADRLIRELKEIRDLAVHAGGPHYVLPNNERTTLTWAIDVISTLAAAKKQGGA